MEVVFEEVAEKETKATFKQKFAVAEECSKLKKYGPMKNMDRLEKELMNLG